MYALNVWTIGGYLTIDPTRIDGVTQMIVLVGGDPTSEKLYICATASGALGAFIFDNFKAKAPVTLHGRYDRGEAPGPDGEAKAWHRLRVEAASVPVLPLMARQDPPPESAPPVDDFEATFPPTQTGNLEADIQAAKDKLDRAFKGGGVALMRNIWIANKAEWLALGEEPFRDIENHAKKKAGKP